MVGSGGGTAKSRRCEVRLKSRLDVPTKDQPTRYRADIVEPPEPEGLLMGRNLKYAVSRSVTDRLSGLQMLLAELCDDIGTRGVTIAENPRQAGLLHESVNEVGRKTGVGLRKVTPIEPDRDAGDLPMARRRILSSGYFAGASILRAGVAARSQSRKPTAGRKAMCLAKAEFDEMWQMQGALAQVIVCVANGTGVRNVTDRIRAVIAIRRRIRGSADAYRIHYEDQGAHIVSFAGSNCRGMEEIVVARSQ
jgi:hypothetical protein